MGKRKALAGLKGAAATVGASTAAAYSHMADASLGPQAPRRQPRQPRSIATVDAVLEASARVFERRGYVQATTNEIAEVAGVSVGSLYQYFPDKDALLTALHERHVETLTDAMLQAMQTPNQGVEDTLTAVVRCCIRVHFDQPRLQRLLHVLFPQLAYPREASAETLRLGRELSLWLQAKNAGLSPEQAARAANTLLIMGESLVHAAVLSPESDIDLLVREQDIIVALLGYLHAQGVADSPRSA